MRVSFENIHLWISIPIVIAAGLSYGFFPDKFLEIQPRSIDEWNFHRAIMMLYFGCSLLWVLGLFKPSFFKMALISHCLFMIPMACGRYLSLLLDGTPSSLYISGTIGELALGFYGLWVLKIKYFKKQ